MPSFLAAQKSWSEKFLPPFAISGASVFLLNIFGFISTYTCSTSFLSRVKTNRTYASVTDFSVGNGSLTSSAVGAYSSPTIDRARRMFDFPLSLIPTNTRQNGSKSTLMDCIELKFTMSAYLSFIDVFLFAPYFGDFGF